MIEPIQNLVVLGSSGWIGTQLMEELDPSTISIPGQVIRQIMSMNDSKVQLANLVNKRPNSVFVNLIGNRRGSESEMEVANEIFPELLADVLTASKNLIIHVGSAAEYGYQGPNVAITEDHDCRPNSKYGRTKLRGSQNIRLLENSIVLRPFNVVGPNLDMENPVSNILNRTNRALDSNLPLTLQNSHTSRDYVPLDFLVKSIKKAIEIKEPGTYNICTGTPTPMNEIVEEIMKRRGVTRKINSTSSDINDVIYGDPRKWAELSGLSASMTASEIVTLVTNHNYRKEELDNGYRN